MRGARHWDARLHSLVGGLPESPADVWLRGLTTAADHGRLWTAIGALLVLRRGALRRGAVRGLASMAVSSGLVNTALKPVFGRRRPDLGAHPVHRLLHQQMTTHSFPSGHSSSAGAFVTGVALECPAAGAALAPLAWPSATRGCTGACTTPGTSSPAWPSARRSPWAAGTGGRCGRAPPPGCGRRAARRRCPAARGWSSR